MNSWSFVYLCKARDLFEEPQVPLIYRGSGIQSSRGYFAYYMSLFCPMKIKYTQQSLFDMRYNRLVVNSIKKIEIVIFNIENEV